MSMHSPDDPSPRRRLSRDERQRQLLEVAWRLVREEGTEALTLGRLAEQAGVMDSELERLRGELQAAERDLHAAEDACGKPAPELVRIDKRPVDPRTRELKTELAYARAALKKLERLANADAAALAAARTRLSAAERALTEHGTE